MGGKYKVDKKLQKMTMEYDGPGGADVSFLISSIREIYRTEDGSDKFPSHAKILLDSEKERALAIHYTNETGQDGILCFLENDHMDKERFLTCMKVLRLYSQTATPKDSG